MTGYFNYKQFSKAKNDAELMDSLSDDAKKLLNSVFDKDFVGTVYILNKANLNKINLNTANSGFHLYKNNEFLAEITLRDNNLYFLNNTNIAETLVNKQQSSLVEKLNDYESCSSLLSNKDDVFGSAKNEIKEAIKYNLENIVEQKLLSNEITSVNRIIAGFCSAFFLSFITDYINKTSPFYEKYKINGDTIALMSVFFYYLGKKISNKSKAYRINKNKSRLKKLIDNF